MPKRFFESQTIANYLTQNLGITEKRTQMTFTQQIGAPDQLTRITREINRAFSDPAWGKSVGFEEPLLFCAEKVAPKCFRAKVAEEHIYEEFTWITDPTGDFISVDQGNAAPTLSTMEKSRQGNVGIRIYLIGRGLKTNPNVILAVESLVTDHIQKAYVAFSWWSKEADDDGLKGNDR